MEEELRTAEAIPHHVAIIMDGNGRWAKQRGKARTFGHKAGVEAVRSAVRFARQSGIQVLTLFAFSSENWRRPEEEVSVLMELFKLVLKSEVKRLHANDVCLKVIGDRSRFSQPLQNSIARAESLTADNKSLRLNIAANYGGRWDICQAAQQLAQQAIDGHISVQQIDEDAMTRHCNLADLPETDLLIRTGGDCRISNFLLWQLAYAELHFTPVLWPDFNEDIFAEAVSVFASRERRFGMTQEQVSPFVAEQTKAG